MKFRWRGFLIAATIVLVIDLTIITMLGVESPRAIDTWWCVNFPSISCLLCCLPSFSMGSGELDEAKDCLIGCYMIFRSCMMWGAAGFWVGWMNVKSPSGQPKHDGDHSFD